MKRLIISKPDDLGSRCMRHWASHLISQALVYNLTYILGTWYHPKGLLWQLKDLVYTVWVINFPLSGHMIGVLSGLSGLAGTTQWVLISDFWVEERLATSLCSTELPSSSVDELPDHPELFSPWHSNRQHLSWWLIWQDKQRFHQPKRDTHHAWNITFCFRLRHWEFGDCYYSIT